ncbi:MAG: glycosyltransferase family 2 protein [Herminiimonas sp.]|nr:glycosyltransferase family 2 protein [Herminiimonas sp.]
MTLFRVLKMTDRKPKVSVCIVTYNHENYLRLCLQSIVDQKTDFDFEVIVGEDCSTDGTRAIVQEFADKYPTLVKPLLHEKNVGPSLNYLITAAAARGQYVASLDGDDCALPGKLQAQVDCLDANPDVAFAAHAVKVMGTDDVMGAEEKYPTKGTVDDLLMHGTYFVHSSVMYRRKNEFDHAHLLTVVDFFMHVERASKGRIFLDRRVLGCYRVHPQGISKNPAYRELLENCYEAAFDRALELGASKEVVQAGRLKRRMAFSVARYLAGDVRGYQHKIKIDRHERSFASTKHLILHWTRFFPNLLGIYTRIRGMA